MHGHTHHPELAVTRHQSLACARERGREGGRKERKKRGRCCDFCCSATFQRPRRRTNIFISQTSRERFPSVPLNLPPATRGRAALLFTVVQGGRVEQLIAPTRNFWPFFFIYIKLGFPSRLRLKRLDYLKSRIMQHSLQQGFVQTGLQLMF